MAKEFHQRAHADVGIAEFGRVGVPQPVDECAADRLGLWCRAVEGPPHARPGGAAGDRLPVAANRKDLAALRISWRADRGPGEGSGECLGRLGTLDERYRIGRDESPVYSKSHNTFQLDQQRRIDAGSWVDA